RVQIDDEIRACLALLRAPGIGQAAARALIERAGSARSACEQARRWRGDFGLSAKELAWIEAPDAARIEADAQWLAQPSHHLLRFTDADFPPQLAQIPQPPAALFIAGDPALLLRAQIAVVGARNASAQGLANAREFARVFARAGLVVTSGMADGIDGAAHAGALDADAATIGVIGTGADLFYPRKHCELAARITAHGAIVSEYPLGTPARAEHFPQRNRLIAGLSLGTLVIEAGLQSGSLITARLAGEQGREVFAVPGSIHNPLARGCHRLIRDGARLVESASEVAQTLVPAARALGAELALRLQEPSAEPIRRTSGGWRDDPQYQRLMEVLGHDPIALDELSARTGQSAGELSSMLLMLELEGWVEGLPGSRYQRLPGM